MRKWYPYSCVILFFWYQLLIASCDTCSGPKYKFALVLSGGGANGIAQIGVLKALDEAGIKPDLIVGTSMGALIGGLYSSGYSAAEVESLACSMDWDNIFSNAIKRNKKFVSQKSEPGNYLFEIRFDKNFYPVITSQSYGQALFDLLVPKLVFPQYRARFDFDSLPIALRIVSTDLLSGSRVVFSKGNLTTALRASCAVPLVFSPVETDSQLLIDGGISSNIPVQCAKECGAGFVVAVDVTSPLWSKSDLENPVKLVDQIISLSISRQKKLDKSAADILITPRLSKHKNTDFDDIDTLISLGYHACAEKIDEIKKQLSAIYKDSTLDFARTSVSTRKEIYPVTIQKIKICGNTTTKPQIIKTAVSLREGDTLSENLLKKSISSLYSTELFETVNAEMDTFANLKFLVNEKKHWRMRLGLRLDEYHLVEAFAQPAYENLFGMGVLAALHIQYGQRREKYAIGLEATRLFSPNISNNLNLQFYISKERLFKRDFERDSLGVDELTLKEITLRKTGIIGIFGTQLGRWSMLSGGIRLEKYNDQQSNHSAFDDMLGLKLKNVLPYFLLRLNFDTMDKFPFPTSGNKFSITTGFTSRLVGAEQSIMKIDASYSRAISFGRFHTISPKISFSYSYDSLPEVERIYLGGSLPEERYQDIRIYNYISFIGLPPMAFRGDVMGLFHLDYTVCIKKKLHVQLIADYGYAWKSSEFDRTSAVRYFFQNAPLGVGAALTLETLIGPLKLTYGQLIKDFGTLGVKSNPEFYFSAGHDF